MSEGPRFIQSQPEINLYRHSKRQHWGVAALLWERHGKRGYQFSDGKMRVFKEGFYGLFEAALDPGDGSAKAVRRLARLARAGEVSTASRLPTLRDQILLFKRSYPEGFRGEAWMHKHRGHKARKRLKRHRDAAIADARQLDTEQLRPLIEGADWGAVLDRMLAVVSSSDAVPGTHVKKLRRVQPTHALALALYQWLGASPDTPDRHRYFNRLVRQLGEAGTWQVVTCLGGLLDPARHTCVRPSVYNEQAKMLLPVFRAKRHPTFKAYERFVKVVVSVFDELVEAGLAPLDLLDVHDFMWETLRPAAREQLLEQYELSVPPPKVVAAANVEPEVEAEVEAA